MRTSFADSIAGPDAAPALPPLNLTDFMAKPPAYLLVAPPPHLLIDCGGRPVPHPLGVGRFVAQLLLMRRWGTCIWLCNVHPGLRRCLHRLHLEAVFHLNE